MSSNRKTRVFSVEEQLFYLVISVVLMLGTGYLALQQSSQASNREQLQFADQLLKNIYEDVATVNGVMTSLPTLLQVSSDTGSDELDVFSQTAIDATNTIKAIGRFERVSHENQNWLKMQMLEQGIYSFNISDMQEDGQLTPAIERPYYYPLVRLQPFNPLSARMIGVDLSADTGLAVAIETAAQSNSSVLVNYPIGWPQTGDVLMIHPTYLGRYVPDNEALRIEQSRGGFMFEINISGILDQQANNINQMDVRIRLKADGIASQNTHLNQDLLHLPVSNSHEKRFFTSLFSGVQKTALPKIGNNTLLVEIRSNAGVTPAALRGAGLVMLLVWCVMIATCAVVRRGKLINMLHQQTQKALQYERATALVTLTAIADAVVTVDENGLITYANPATERLLKLTDSELIGQNISTALRFELLLPKQEAASKEYSVAHALHANKPFKFPELRVIDTQGCAIEVDSSLSPLGGAETRQGAVLAMRDVSSERLLLKELEYLATHDSLTKIANRYLFERHLQDLMDSSLEHNIQHAICFIDLDKFKIVNDTCGHPAGDRLLLQVTNGIQNIISESDTLARLGGDEFGLLIRNRSEKESEALAHSVHEFFKASYFREEEHVFPVRASLGFVHINGLFQTVDSILKAADLACYFAKDNGRNTLHKYAPSDAASVNVETEAQLMPKLTGALEGNRFCLALQPLVSMTSQNEQFTSQYEILLRYKNDNGQMEPPNQLLAAAKRYDKAYEIDKWVISNALLAIKEYEDKTGDDSIIFSINLSGQTAANDELFDYIKGQLRQNNLSGESLGFEVSEADALVDVLALNILFTRLQAIGCLVGLDDFGSGVNSFGILASLPLDYLKIDGHIINAVDTKMINREIVRCTNTVASNLNITPIAENVKNRQILDSLISLGVQSAQGQHFGEPFPIEQLLNNNPDSKAA